MLAEQLGLYHISVGGLIRKRIEDNDAIAIQMQHQIKHGKLIATSDTIKLIKETLTDVDNHNGIIFDGFPRNHEQGMAYFELVASLNTEQIIVINIELSEAEATKRLLSRYTCSNCDASYSYSEPAMSPKIKGICDKCGGTLMLRADDNKASLKERFVLYNNETKPLLNYFKDLGVEIIKINGEQSKEAINSDILKALSGATND